jgi:hypothetical protein
MFNVILWRSEIRGGVSSQYTKHEERIEVKNDTEGLERWQVFHCIFGSLFGLPEITEFVLGNFQMALHAWNCHASHAGTCAIQTSRDIMAILGLLIVQLELVGVSELGHQVHDMCVSHMSSHMSMDTGTHSFKTMSHDDMVTSDYVMFNDAVRAAFFGVDHAYIDTEIAGLIFRNAAVKYRFVVENHMTYIVLNHVIPRHTIEQVFDRTAKRLCFYGALDKARRELTQIPEDNARAISIGQNFVEAIEGYIRDLT